MQASQKWLDVQLKQSMFIKELQQLMKDQRREKYTIKTRIEKKQKAMRQQKITIGGGLAEKIGNLDPQGLIDYMTEDYEQFIKRHEDMANSLNNAIIVHLQKMKSKWRQFHKDRFLAYLQKIGVQFKQNTNLPIQQNIANFASQGKQKYSCYPAYANGQHYYSFVEHLNPNRYTSYYLAENDERIDFKIEYKRMAKDTIEMCRAFLNLAGTVKGYLKLEEYSFV